VQAGTNVVLADDDSEQPGAIIDIMTLGTEQVRLLVRTRDEGEAIIQLDRSRVEQLVGFLESWLRRPRA